MSEIDKNIEKDNSGKRNWLNRLKRELLNVATFISLAALVFSIYTYFETTKPHTQFEEVCKKLEILKEEINEAKKRIEQWRSLNSSSQYLKNLQIYEEYLQQSEILYQEARGYLISGNYTQAEQLIKEAHEIVKKIPILPLTPKPWWAIPGFTIGTIVGAIIVALAIRVLVKARK